MPYTPPSLLPVQTTEAEPLTPEQTAVTGGGRVAVIAPDGQAGTIPAEGLEDALRNGYKVEGREGYTERRLDQLYGDSPIQAGLEGAARTLSFGASDAIIGGLGGEDVREGLRERRERNAGAATVGEIAGYLTPMGAESALARGAGEIAGHVAGRALSGLAEGGILARAAARAGTAAAKTAAEGGIMGVQQGISDAILAKDPMSAEAIIGDLGHHVLVGAGLGAGAGAATSLAGSALNAVFGQASKALGKVATKLQKELADSTEGMLSTTDTALRDEVMAMSRPQLEAAQKAETEALKAQRLAEGKAVAQDIDAFYQESRDDLFKIRQQLPNKSLIGDAIRPTKKLKNVLADLEGLAEQPTTALKPLRELGQSIDKMQQYLPEASLKPMADRVAALKERLTDMVGEPTSERLEAFGERMKMLDRPPPKTPMLDAAAQSAGATIGGTLGRATGIPYAGMAGAWLGKEFGDVLKPLMKRVLGSFTDHAAGVEDGVSKFMTKLGAPGPAMDAVERLAAASAVSGGSAYERAIRAVTSAASDPQGTQGHLDEQLAGLSHAAPELAGQVKQGLLAKVAFLASKVPQTVLGPFGDVSEPPDSVKATFARYVAAAEDPLRIVKELRAKMVMPETVEAATALYPQHLERLKQAITTQLADPKVRGRVTYPMRLQLAMILGPQVDPTLAPSFIAMMQAPKVQQAKPPTGAPEPTSAQRLTTGGLQ